MWYVKRVFFCSHTEYIKLEGKSKSIAHTQVDFKVLVMEYNEQFMYNPFNVLKLFNRNQTICLFGSSGLPINNKHACNRGEICLSIDTKHILAVSLQPCHSMSGHSRQNSTTKQSV